VFRPHAFGALLLACTALHAEVIADPMRVLKKERCATGVGFFLWDSNRCLLEGDLLFLNGKRFKLTHEEWATVYQKRRGVISMSDRNRVSYRATGFNVRIDLTYLPGCNYSDDQCTYRNYFAKFKLLYPDGTVVEFQGVGYSGS